MLQVQNPWLTHIQKDSVLFFNKKKQFFLINLKRRQVKTHLLDLQKIFIVAEGTVSGDVFLPLKKYNFLFAESILIITSMFLDLSLLFG